MKKAVASIILAIVLVFMFVGCDNIQSNISSSDESSSNVSTIDISSNFDSSVPNKTDVESSDMTSSVESQESLTYNREEEQKEKYRKIALAKNVNELDDFSIKPIPSLRKTVELYYDYDYSKYSIVYVDEKKGIVDYDGNILLPIKYDEIRLDDWGLVVDNNFYSNGLENYQPYGGHGLLDRTYYWDVENNKLFVLSTAFSQVDEDVKSENLLSAVRSFKVEKENGYGDYQVTSLIGKYGYQRSGELITKLEFDCVHEFYDGFAAAKKDGLWGYIDENGKVAIDFQFDDISEANIDFATKMFKKTPPYDFSNGYAGVCKGGMWAYIDKTGKEVTPFIYYDTLPVYKNKAWVCEQGYGWHVIDVK